jgi:hypothetical protein
MASISGSMLINVAVAKDYPVQECIRHHLPLLDEILVGVFHAQDGTDQLLAEHFANEPKVRLVTDGFGLKPDTPFVLWVKALKDHLKARAQGDWILNLDADDFYHERDFPYIRELTDRYTGRKAIIGFEFKHFMTPELRLVWDPLWKWKQPLFPNDPDLSAAGTADGSTMLPSRPGWTFVEADCFAYHMKPFRFAENRPPEGGRFIRYDLERMPLAIRENPARFTRGNGPCLEHAKPAEPTQPGVDRAAYARELAAWRLS